jgi:DNA polymerase-3 subunit gamma/tau
MLNLVDRCELITLLEQLLKGQTQEAIHFLNTYYTRGGDPLTLLNELLTTCHWLSLLKIDPALTEDDGVSAQEKQLGLALAAKSSIPVLTRFWQVLLKGIHEVALVPSVLQGVQMIFIRLAYMASLPTPQQIIQGFLEGKDPTPITSHAAAGHRATGMSPAGQSELSSGNALVSEGEKASAILNPPAEVTALPSSFKDLVALVGQKKEPLLQASLHHDVHLIDYKPGEMTVRLSSLAPRDFVPKLSEKLKLWTGIPWKIHVMSEGGDLTLAEQNQQEKKAMMAKIHANPLVKATLESFPGAVIESLEE